MTFFLNEKPVDLAPTQFYLLDHLFRHAGCICTWESCAEAIWGQDYDPCFDALTLDRAMNRLRSDLRQVNPAVHLIETCLGLGYTFNF
jgi:DNA-binding response OmpR family regulator